MVADGVFICGGGLHETVHDPVVYLDAPSRITVVGVIEAAACPVGRQLMRGMADAVDVLLCQAGLFPLGVRQSTRKMVEAAVLHHHHYDVLDL